MRLMADRTERLDRFLARLLPEQSRSRLVEHIEDGRVRVEGEVRKPSFRLQPGMEVLVEEIPERPPQDLSPEPIPLDVLYEDEHLLVVNKPAGLAAHPSTTSRQPTLAHALLAHSEALSTVGGEFRPGIVHRLDKDTSGAILVAKTDAVHRKLQAQIQSRVARRLYWAWVAGAPRDTTFGIRTHIGRHPRDRKRRAVVSSFAPDAREAITHCRLLLREQGLSLLECRLETGRTHQIRVHLAHVRLPLLGDMTYGVAHPIVARQALHARTISFVHPETSEHITLHAPVPPDLEVLPLPEGG
ncbi:MAG: RluA family pseudouridine synthase [Armatimonadota bacterium]